MKRTNLLWIGGVVLGWFFDFLFWKAAPGINFAIYAALCLAGGFLVLRLNGIRPSWKALILLIPILFFGAMSFIRVEMMSNFLAVALTLGLMALLAVSYLGGKWPWYSLSDYVANSARLVGSMVARPLIFRSERQKALAEETTDPLKVMNNPAGVPGEGVAANAAASKLKWKRTWAVLRGLLIAIPILIIFAALLSSADLVFAQRLDDFTRLFRLEKLPEYIFRGVYILIGAYVLVGIFLHAGQKSQDEKLIGTDKPLVPPFLGFTEAAVVLGAVVLLFATFVVIQFAYFFGGQTNIGIAGYTYSEYARRGFGELVAVAVITLLLFLLLSAVVKRKNNVQRWTFSGLGIAMVALVGVMLVSAFQRLLLYEAAYGFTRLRMYTHVFMIWLGILLAAVAALEVLRRERFFAAGVLLASIGFAATLMLLNVDGTIIRQNVARSPEGKGLDVAYLASLSTDSVPALVDRFQDPSMPLTTREAVGAVLVCREELQNSRESDWRSFTLSSWNAEKLLQGVNGQLKKYILENENWPATVTTPDGVKYECQASSGFAD